MNNEFDASKTSIKNSVSSLVEQGSEAMQAVRARVGEVNESAAAVYDKTTTYIQAHPLKAIAIAYGAGYLVMRISTSPLFKIALLGGLALAGSQFVRRAAGSQMGSQPRAMGGAGAGSTPSIP